MANGGAILSRASGVVSAVHAPRATTPRRSVPLPTAGAVQQGHLMMASSQIFSRENGRTQAGIKCNRRNLSVTKAIGPQEVGQLAAFEVESDFLYLPTWTPDQLAGLAFGGLMMACFYLARNFDEWVAGQQREELGLCRKCGGLNDPALCKEGDCPMTK